MSTTTETNEDQVVGTTTDELREQALSRVKKRRDLKAHAAVYVLVNLAIWGIWIAIAANSGSWWPWPIFVTLFWGVGLAMNAWTSTSASRSPSRSWSGRWAACRIARARRRRLHPPPDAGRRPRCGRSRSSQ